MSLKIFKVLLLFLLSGAMYRVRMPEGSSNEVQDREEEG